jgi:hypothetical protein
MSTKTIYKRIALVAVAALGAGVLSVAPANAAAANFASTPTLSASAATAIVGSTNTISASLASGTALDGLEADTLKGVISLTVPAESTVALTDRNGDANGTTSVFANTGKATVFTTSALSTATVTATSDVATPAVTLAANTAAKVGEITIIPDVPGTYTVTWTGRNAAGDANTTAVSYTLTVRSLAYTTGSVAAATPFDTGSGVAGPANTVTVTGHSTDASGVRALVTVEGAGATIASATAASGTSVIAADFKSVRIPAATSAPVVINTPQVGTVTVKLFNETGSASGLFSATADNTVTITVTVASVAGVYASTLAYMNTSTTTPNLASDITTTATAPSAAATASNVPVANILVSQVDAQATPTNVATEDTKAIVYEIAGAGALGTSNSQRLGSYIAVAAASANDNNVFIFPDGRSGVGTITVKVNGVLVSTKKVNFYGAVTTYTATVAKKHIANSGSSTADVVKVTAKDGNGVVVPSAVIYATAGTSTIGSIDSSATTDSTGVAVFAATGSSAKFGTFTVTFLNATTAAAATVTTTAVIGVSSVLAKTVTAKSDKATYAPGEKITWTLTFLDANGLGIPDNAAYGAGTLLKSDAANPVASASLASTPFLGTATLAVVAGVATAISYAPLASGPVSYTWTLAGTAGAADTANLVTALQATTVTASASVTSNTDIAALTTLVNSLIAKINALNKLVIKIQKKVRA